MSVKLAENQQSDFRENHASSRRSSKGFEEILNSMPTVGTVVDLKSGARAKLVHRSGTMAIIEVDKYRSDLDRMNRGESRDRDTLTRVVNRAADSLGSAGV